MNRFQSLDSYYCSLASPSALQPGRQSNGVSRSDTGHSNPLLVQAGVLKQLRISVSRCFPGAKVKHNSVLFQNIHFTISPFSFFFFLCSGDRWWSQACLMEVLSKEGGREKKKKGFHRMSSRWQCVHILKCTHSGRSHGPFQVNEEWLACLCAA